MLQYLAKSAGTIFFGQPGVSKTAHTAALVAHLCMGLNFAGMVVARACRVLYISLDAGWDWTGDLFMAAFRGVGVEGLPESFAFYSPLDEDAAEDGGDALDNSLEFIGPALLEATREHRADLVVIDSLGQFIAGDADKAQDVSLALRTGLNPLRATGAAVLVIDHATKAARIPGAAVPTPAGSQQKRAWARVTVALEEDEFEGEKVTRWSVDKTNAKPFEPFCTRLTFESRGERLHSLTLERLGEAGKREPEPNLSARERGRRAVVAQLRQRPSNWKTLRNLEGISSDSAIKRVLDQLKGDGLVGYSEATKLYSLLPASNPLRGQSLEVDDDNPAQEADLTTSIGPGKKEGLEVDLEATSKQDFQATSKGVREAEKSVQDGASKHPKPTSKPVPEIWAND